MLQAFTSGGSSAGHAVSSPAPWQLRALSLVLPACVTLLVFDRSLLTAHVLGNSIAFLFFFPEGVLVATHNLWVSASALSSLATGPAAGPCCRYFYASQLGVRVATAKAPSQAQLRGHAPLRLCHSAFPAWGPGPVPGSECTLGLLPFQSCTLIVQLRRPVRMFTAHVAAQMTALMIALLATAAMLLHQYAKKAPHFTSTHSWLGISSLLCVEFGGLFGALAFSGVLQLLPEQLAVMRFVHKIVRAPSPAPVLPGLF